MLSNMTNDKNASLKRHPAYYAGEQASLKTSRPRPLPGKEPGLAMDQFGSNNSFSDHTNVSDTSSKKVVEIDEKQIGLWMEELELREETTEKPHLVAEDGLTDESHLLRGGRVAGMERIPDRFSPEMPSNGMRDLDSCFSDDMSSADIPEFPLIPISRTDMTTPVLTNPFGNPDETFRPLSPFYSVDYIDLPDVFVQPCGYIASVLQASSSSPTVSCRNPEELEKSIERALLRSRAKEISPLDTSRMTPADRKVLRRVMFNQSQSRRHASSKYKPKLAAAFRARQREIKARKASHSRPIVPPRPKKSFVIPYFHRQESDLESDTRILEGTVGE